MSRRLHSAEDFIGVQKLPSIVQGACRRAVRLTMIVLVSGLAACDVHPVTTALRPPVLQGAVHWTSPTLHTAATIGDIQSGGTVALVDPTSHETLEATQAASGTGAFSFPFTAVTLSPGYYWLEAARFISGSRMAGVTLRTILHYDGAAWDSITGTDVQITPLTTAVARVRALDPVVTDAATIGSVVADALAAPLVTYSPTVLDQLAAEIEVAVANGGDGAGDLPLPATITPVTGTPGITQLTWTGIPLAFDFHGQVASGTDAAGAPQVETAPASLGAMGWTSTAPVDLVGPSQLRLQTGTARTLAVTWTPLPVSTLVPTGVGQVTAVDSPAGPVAAWKGDDNLLRVADVGNDGLGSPAVLGAGGDELALGGSGPGVRHLLMVTVGIPYHRVSNGANWSSPQIVPTATTPVSAPQLVDDGQGGLWGAWLSGVSGGTMLEISHWTSGTWHAPEVVAGGANAFAIVGGLEPQVAYVEPTDNGPVVQYSRRAFGHWSEPVTLSASGRDVAAPAITLDAAAQPFVLWLDQTTVASGQKAQMVAFRALSAGTWIAEERFTPSVVPAVSRAGLAIDPNGVPVAYFLNGSAGLVQISRRTAAVTSPGSWGKPITLDRAGAGWLAGVPLTGRFWLFWADGASAALKGLPVVW